MSFEPLTASTSQWSEIFLDIKNHRKDFKDLEAINETPCSRMFALLATFPRDVRSKSVIRVVNALLNSWSDLDQLLTEKERWRGALHPVEHIRQLALVNGEPEQYLTKIVQTLFVVRFKPNMDVGLLLRGLGDLVPFDESELQRLYHTKFPQYAQSALSVLLDKGHGATANSLFISRVREFNTGYDPAWLDHLVAKGLSVAAAKKWLDLSVNATKIDNRSWYDSALERWAELAAQAPAISDK